MVAGVGVVMAGAFFPLMFDKFAPYDDEGLFLVSLRQFLAHGSLYVHTWGDKYGPFYYLVLGSYYKLIGRQPTLENGRLTVLLITAASAALFAASVWRVTKNLPCTVLCQVSAFLILIDAAGNEPIHPGSLGVLLVAVVAYALAGYAMAGRTMSIVAAGFATGALVMTKINVGLFAVAALVVLFTVGSRSAPRWMRLGIASLAAAGPIFLMFSNLATQEFAEFALLMSASLVGVFVVMSADRFALPADAWVKAGGGAVLAVGVSAVWPLATGTSVPALFSAVVTRALAQGSAGLLPSVPVNWFAVVITVVGITSALAIKRSATPLGNEHAWLPRAALAVAALTLLGVGTISIFDGSRTIAWLPTIALLPALAYCADVAEPVRLALRALVLLALFQVLVAYPLSGSQAFWATAALTVPCALAIAVGIERFDAWKAAGPAVRALVTASLCVLLVAATAWPPSLWDTYTNSPKLNLAGARFVRLDPTVTASAPLQQITHDLLAHCDTFFPASGPNGFYIFTGLVPPTGLTADFATARDNAQQREIISRLNAVEAPRKRLCVLRDVTLGDPADGSGPLSRYLAQFDEVVGASGNYTVSVRAS